MHPFSSNVKARCAIMHLRKFASTWWRMEEEKLQVSIDTISWELFLESFKDRFMSDQWRQGRAEELHHLKQNNMLVEDYERKFYELKPFSGYKEDGPMLVQHFIRGFNGHIFGDVAVFEPKSLRDAIAKAFLVERNVNLSLGGHSDNRGGHFSHKKKSQNYNQSGRKFQYQQNHGNSRTQQKYTPQPSQNSQNINKGSYQQSSAPSTRNFVRNTGCYSCGQHGHIAVHCPQRTKSLANQNQAASEPIVGNASQSHRIFAEIEQKQTDHQGTIIETTSSLKGKTISILFDSGAIDSFISPSLVEKCGLVAKGQGVKWRHEISTIIVEVDLKSKILNALPLDDWYQEVRSEIASGRTLEGRYTGYTMDIDGLLRCMGRIYVPPSDGL
ncbi:uncharacterized protein LOC131054379 [Cryptomeria japonica]|uniref:uncharacterized protein LOC131054379 n=1 Tax=Cryptomeria japonica TaxID=3369 RepID=UPI0027DAA7A6|nr:uncharacterized protein LOC131054379 [Cryptomeria japonica]